MKRNSLLIEDQLAVLQLGRLSLMLDTGNSELVEGSLSLHNASFKCLKERINHQKKIYFDSLG